MSIKGLIYVIFFTANTITAQSFNGEFTSNRTSFKDIRDEGNSFVEDSRFNIFIQINETESKGIIIVQDPRIPKKLLIYNLYSKGVPVTNESNKAVFYKAYTDHLKTPMKTDIVLYISKKDNSINLMIADTLSSQVFHDLLRQ